MAVQPWRKGIVTRIEEEALLTSRFWIEVPELERFDFEPGQFVTLDLPIHEKPAKRMRSYSIASWPDGTNTMELVVVLNETGAGTPYIFKEFKIGSEVVLRGPQGVFTMPENLERDLFLICTGTGIAPFRSFAHHIKNHSIPHKQIYLIFGCRTQQSLLYHEEMKQLTMELEGFHYIPVLSREQWDGRSGYVHAIYEELCSNKPPAWFYVCGWKNMIDEARERIAAMGYDKKDIHRELYG